MRVFAALLGALAAPAAAVPPKRQHLNRALLADLGRAGHESGGNKTIPDFKPSYWGGQNFHNSPLSYNPWVARPDFRVLGDLRPTAPFDRTDKATIGSITGSAPTAPGQSHAYATTSSTAVDFVPPYQHAETFPWEQGGIPCRDSRSIPIGKRIVVAKPDRLRQYWAWETRPCVNYPLVAPGSRISWDQPHAVTQADRIPHKYARLVNQLYDSEMDNLEAAAAAVLFRKVDGNKDNAVSNKEFKNQVKDIQGKSDEQANSLWKKYHVSQSSDMTMQEFYSVAVTGFDLGYINRTDVNLVLTPTNALPLGYWGGGVGCPAKTYLKGARIKVMPTADGKDNTAMTGIEVKCSDDSTIKSIEGKTGAWTEFADCPDGMMIDGFRSRMKDYDPSGDNTGMNDIEFYCRTESLNASALIRFGKPKPAIGVAATAGFASKTVLGAGDVATQGGWGPKLVCQGYGLLCGVQARLETEFNIAADGVSKDDLGLTDLRLFCCINSVDCSGPCGTTAPAPAPAQASFLAAGTPAPAAATPKALSPECLACKAAAKPPTAVGIR